MTDHRGFLTEEQAAEVWRRAAQLQAEAEQLMDTRALAPSAREAVPGLPVAAVEAAAVDAGISADFVRQALAEVPHESPEEARTLGARLTNLMMGKGPRRMAATRAFAATPSEVLAAIQRVLPGQPYGMALVDSTGDPLTGGTLVLEFPVDAFGNHPKLKMLGAAGCRRVRLSIRPSAGGGCEVHLTGELRASLSEPNTIAGLMVGFGGGGGGIVGSVIGIKLIGLSGAMILAPGLGGIALAAVASVAGHRSYYRWCLREGAEELAGILATLDAHLRTGGGFALPTAPPGLPGGDPSALAALGLLRP